MRYAIGKTGLKPALRRLQWLLAAAAVVLLGYCALVVADGWRFQQSARRQLGRRVSPASSRSRPMVGAGGLVASIEIPRLGISAVVAEGVDTLTLRRAVGHIPGTGLPGEPGNIVLAGHRDTFFRPLRNIERNDIVKLVTPLGEYRYRVVSTKV